MRQHPVLALCSKHVSSARRAVIGLLCLVSLATSLQSQVSSRATVAQPAPGAARNLVPTPVRTAALRGLLELGVPQGTTIYIRNDPALFNSNGTPIHAPSGRSFQREVRNGRLALVETSYEGIQQKTRIGTDASYLKPGKEWVHPGESKLVYTGPWFVQYLNLKTALDAFFVYLLRPLNSPVVTAIPRAGSATLAELNTRAGALTGSSVTAKPAPNLAALIPSSTGCEVKFVAATVQQGAEIGNLVCLLLQDGQGVTLDDGTRLFRRQSMIEIWKGDQVVGSTLGLVARDGQGRHWVLEPKGYH